MDKILLNYNQECSKQSDINEHLPILLKYSKECNHITEMGVRWVSSTWAFLLSNPKKMISYDIVKNPNVNNVENICREYNIDYNFFELDVLKVEIDQTDLLFLDTLHTYNQLSEELKKHSNKVKKYIILHDTESFGFSDENIYNHASEDIKNRPQTKQGLVLAINDFLTSEIGSVWKIKDQFKNNNGLTVLEKK